VDELGDGIGVALVAFHTGNVLIWYKLIRIFNLKLNLYCF